MTWALAIIVDPRIHVGVPSAGQLALGALIAAFGLAGGLALRNPPAAVGTVLAIALGSSPALASSPASTGSELQALAAGVVLLAWTALIATIALARLTRSDA